MTLRTTIAQGSLSTVACSDGTNGLLTKHFTTVRLTAVVPQHRCCPSRRRLELYSVWVVLEDISSEGSRSTSSPSIMPGDGFNLSLEAMDTLTNGQAQQLGVINAQATQVDCESMWAVSLAEVRD
ncbi:hypothetical protein H4582DRAFT_2060580 [Lactarius indigo]|nr:hypothetical protein H4582DRAFT_2060580 [Lactarius indigo]